MQNNEPWTTSTIQANGLTFHCLEIGQGPLILALHGFPDLPRTFRCQMPALAAAGYRVVAPYLRGYPPSDIPPEGPYESAVLIQDVLAMLEGLTDEPAVLLGHDLGAAAAYGAAILAPDRVASLITIAVPPGGALTRSLLTNPVQQRRSWYMYYFQMPFAEMAVAHDDFAFLERLWRDWSPGWAPPPEELEALKAAFRQPGALRAALSYYRHTLNPAHHRPDLAEIRKRQGEPVPVPALYLHGAKDGCVGVELTEGMERFYQGRFEKRILSNAGHFVHQEQPEEVNREILEFLSI
jgi:pimeloyl-ACP methyl ester carboxylesterase